LREHETGNGKWDMGNRKWELGNGKRELGIWELGYAKC
jgi:hypothetical protein